MGEELFLYIAAGGAVIWILVRALKIGICSDNYHPTAVDLVIPAIVAGVVVANAVTDSKDSSK